MKKAFLNFFSYVYLCYVGKVLEAKKTVYKRPVQ